MRTHGFCFSTSFQTKDEFIMYVENFLNHYISKIIFRLHKKRHTKQIKGLKVRPKLAAGLETLARPGTVTVPRTIAGLGTVAGPGNIARS